MKVILLRTVWPVVAGLLAAFVVMTVFEYINSFFYPLPEWLDTGSYEAVLAFTRTLPWTAYLMVLLGWIAGSYVAGRVATRLSREERYRVSLSVGVILTVLGIANNLMIGHALWFSVIGLPTFVIFTYLGHHHAMRRRSVLNA